MKKFAVLRKKLCCEKYSNVFQKKHILKMPGGTAIDASVLNAEARRLEKGERMEEFLKTALMGGSQSTVETSVVETATKHGESFEKIPMTFVFFMTEFSR